MNENKDEIMEASVAASDDEVKQEHEEGVPVVLYDVEVQ